MREAIYTVLREDRPMTVRQVFYRLVSRGAIAKTETEYKATVGRLLTEMRRDGEVPFGWIADNTRWMRKPRTYSSLSFLYEAAQAIGHCRKPAYLYYFGDYDPSGMDITRTVERSLREFAPWAELHFERVAVTPAQIAAMRLPTRPTKQTDSRSKHFAGESVEVDAIPPRALRELARDCITRHVDQHKLDVLQVAEASERSYLATLAGLEEVAE